MRKRALYSQLVRYYDRIYWWKDYSKEVDFLVEAFRRFGIRGRRVLEVACGTGNHSRLLVERGYEVTGVDVSDDMLRIARSKVKRNAKFIRGDMRDLDTTVEGLTTRRFASSAQSPTT